MAPFARLVGFSDNFQTLIAEPIVHWEDDISDALDHCQIWADALAATDVASQNRVAFQVSQLGLDVVLGLEDFRAAFTRQLGSVSSRGITR